MAAARVEMIDRGWSELLRVSEDETARTVGRDIKRDAMRNLAASYPRVAKRFEPRTEIRRAARGYEIAVDDDLGAIFEQGAKAHEIRARWANALRFTIGGRTFFRKRVWHPGITGRHFLRAAAIKVRS